MRGKLHKLNPMSVWPKSASGKQTSIDNDIVRPELSLKYRFSHGREVYTTNDAVICVAYCNDIPLNIDDLTIMAGIDIAVFYTVWSYEPKAGQIIVNNIYDYLVKHKLWISRYVTLSPKTDMAKHFHLNNGAVIFRENKTSINYEY